MRYIIYTTNDKYRHIIHIAASVKEMAELTGKSMNSIHSNMSKYKAGKLKAPRFEYVDIEED